MFERWLEINSKKSSLIIGPRRSGKTTLLKMRFPEYNYITLDNLDYLNWAGREIDLIFESEEEVYAIEIKNTLRPSSRDVSNLIKFSKSLKKKIKIYLVYMGDKHSAINDVTVIPVVSLFRGQ